MLASTVGGFARWWLSELRDLRPARRRHTARISRRIVLTPEGDSVRAHIEDRGRREVVAALGAGQAIPVASLASALGTLPDRVRRLPVSIRVNASDCHERLVTLPASAQKDFDRLLLLDLERSTPLKTADLLCGHVVVDAESARGMVQVRHLLLKRRTIDPLMRELHTAGITPTSVECWNHDGSAALATDFLRAAPEAERPARRPVARVLATIAVLLALSAVTIHWVKQEQALSALAADSARLDAELSEARRASEYASASETKVASARRLVDGRASAVQILEEVTRLVPDTAWLEELRIDGDVVEIGGLAASATALLPSFEKSPLFHETRFTAPLQLDHATDRERFRLRARLRSTIAGEPAKGAEVSQ